MRLGNRLFPYPVLNNDKSISLYNESSFDFLSKVEINQKQFVLKDTYYVLTNNKLNELIKSGMAEVLCVVECSTTVYREVFTIGDEPKDIVIDVKRLNGKVTVSAYIYAKNEIIGFNDEDFDVDYKDYSFQIEQYDILAADDGFTTKVVYEDDEDDKISSIFLVIKDAEDNLNEMKVELLPAKIQITIPEKQFNKYENLKTNEYFRNMFFSFFIIPSLVYAFEHIKKENFENALMEYDWFSSVQTSYKEKTGKELNESEFENVSPFYIAQIVMDYPVIKAIDELMESVLNKRGVDDE
ncbi:MAG: hypothetical protein ACVCEJ_03240 [Candidatus Izemoplasmataceae bacterium]